MTVHPMVGNRGGSCADRCGCCACAGKQRPRHEVAHHTARNEQPGMGRAARGVASGVARGEARGRFNQAHAANGEEAMGCARLDPELSTRIKGHAARGSQQGPSRNGLNKEEIENAVHAASNDVVESSGWRSCKRTHHWFVLRTQCEKHMALEKRLLRLLCCFPSGNPFQHIVPILAAHIRVAERKTRVYRLTLI